MKLEIEPIPSQNWGISLAHLLPKKVWDSLRREVYELSDYTCSICGSTERQLHCHERWKYNDKRRYQILVGFQCLCRYCHAIKHWGRTVAVTEDRELLSVLVEHFCKVNNCSVGDLDSHREKVSEIVRRRSRYNYKIRWGKFSPEEVTRIWISTRDQK